jgi:hypothetical protein
MSSNFKKQKIEKLKKSGLASKKSQEIYEKRLEDVIDDRQLKRESESKERILDLLLKRELLKTELRLLRRLTD